MKIIKVYPRSAVKAIPEGLVSLGLVNGESVNRVIKAIQKSDKKKEFFLYIKGPGGSVIDGLEY